MRCIISYDVSDDKRRRRVVKRLLRCAFRIQYSVFEGDLEESQWGAVWRDLNRIIEPSEDGLLLVPMCAGCGRGRREAGTTGRGDFEDTVII